jgi:hypothetical protein
LVDFAWLLQVSDICKELNAIFAGYHIVSSKILRDSMGNSRGVGFARSVSNLCPSLGVSTLTLGQV